MDSASRTSSESETSSSTVSSADETLMTPHDQIEEWRQIVVDGVDCPGQYASSWGRIKLKSGKISTARPITRNGYIRVSVYDANGKKHNKLIHVLVALVFHPNPENKSTVDHINRIKHDNHVNNLRWATGEEQGKNKNPWKHAEKVEEPLHIDGEIWRSIDGFPGVLEVSNMGRVITERGKLTRGSKHDGYLFSNKHRIHRMVAMAFHPLPDYTGLVPNHINNIGTDNRADNLEWVTRSQNSLHYQQFLPADRYKNLCIPVHRIDMITGQIIASFKSQQEAAETCGISSGALNEVCRGKRNFALGSRWVYATDYDPSKDYRVKGKTVVRDGKEFLTTENIKRVKKPVYQINKDTLEIVAKFETQAQAMEVTGVFSTSINMACRGKYKTAGGFMWCYPEDYDKIVNPERYIENNEPDDDPPLGEDVNSPNEDNESLSDDD
jgi:hypothetical protein